MKDYKNFPVHDGYLNCLPFFAEVKYLEKFTSYFKIHKLFLLIYILFDYSIVLWTLISVFGYRGCAIYIFNIIIYI